MELPEVKKDVPAVKNKNMKTLTMCARAHKMFPDLENLARTGPTPVSLLVLGPGNDKGFVPEYLELHAIFWRKEVQMDVVDHNQEVIDALKAGKIYTMPSLKSLGIGAAAQVFTRYLKFEVIPEEKGSLALGTVTDPTKSDEYHFDLPHPLHHVNFFQGDFTEFNYGTFRYDAIIALNSIFYLLNNPQFEPFCYPYLKKLIASLNVGGMLFIDKITFDILRDWKNQGIDNIEVTNLGAFPNFTYRFQRIKE